jgi:heme exporter protein C
LLLTAILFAYGLRGGLFIAPEDYLQGDGFRIMYVHVPCAFYSLTIYVAMAFCSAIYLIWHIKIADVIAYCLAPIGALLTFCALVTGALWGKPMWGTWWIWDARLTSELILLFLYLGYIALYSAIVQQKAAAKACAILSLVGVLDIPIIHYSVYWWNTLHQGATVAKLSAPSIDKSMFIPLCIMILGFAFYILSILCLRVRAELVSRERQHLWVRQLYERRTKGRH